MERIDMKIMDLKEKANILDKLSILAIEQYAEQKGVDVSECRCPDESHQKCWECINRLATKILLKAR